MERTLSLATQYDGQLDATLLVNCLLGLLIVPKEALIEKIPRTEFAMLYEWGIKPDSIKKIGKCDCGHEHQPDLRQLVRRLRNAVAHFRIEPIHSSDRVSGFSFRDQSGFYAVLSLEELKEFVTCLSRHLAPIA